MQSVNSFGVSACVSLFLSPQVTGQSSIRCRSHSSSVLFFVTNPTIVSRFLLLVQRKHIKCINDPSRSERQLSLTAEATLLTRKTEQTEERFYKRSHK